MLFSASSDYIVKVIKFVYGIPKACNHWFATYYKYHKNKLGRKKLIYDSFFFYSSGLFGIVEMQTNDILILANNDFVSKEKAAIKSVKIMTKN